MFAALLFFSLAIVFSVGGAEVLAGLVAVSSHIRLVGGLVRWYVGLAGPVGTGMTATLLAGLLTVQIIVVAGSVLIYGPSWARKALSFAQHHASARHQWKRRCLH